MKQYYQWIEWWDCKLNRRGWKKTQRQEFQGVNTNPRVYYQDIVISLVKADNDWKVKGAYWQ